MPVAETLGIITLKLAPVFAEALAEFLLGKSLSSTVVAKLSQLYADRVQQVLDEGKQKEQLQALGKTVAAQVADQHRAALTHLPKNERLAVVEEVVTTLAQANLSADWLVREARLTPDRLHTQLQKRAVEGLATNSRRVYDALLKDCATALTRVALQLPHYQTTMDAVALQDHEQFLAFLNRFFAQPSEAARKFEERYRTAIGDELNHMDIFGVTDYQHMLGERQPLSVSFVCLSAEWKKRTTDEERHQVELEKRLMGTNVPPKYFSGDVDLLLAQASRLVVRAPAGMGKTTLLRWLVVQCALGEFKGDLAAWNDYVPFYVQLRDYVGQIDALRPENFLSKQFDHLLPAPEGWIKDVLETGRALIVLDGVDELPADQREAMRQKVARWVRDYAPARFVVSSRDYALQQDRWPEWETWITQENFVEAALTPMTPTQITSFVAHWYQALDKRRISPRQKELPSYSTDLQHQMQDPSPMRQLAETPLMCAMLCALHHDHYQELPRRRGELYDQCIKLLFQRERLRKILPSAEEELKLDDTLKRKLAEELAYEMMDNKLSRMTETAAEKCLGIALHKLKQPDTLAPNARRHFVYRISLLREPVVGEVEFVHRTFQEYLAACAMWRLQKNRRVVTDRPSDWQEVILLAANMPDREVESQRLVLDLLAEAQKADKEDARLYALLAVATWGLKLWQDDETDSAIPPILETLVPPHKDAEIALLAEGGERIIPFLANKATYQDSEAAQCVKTLLRIGTPAVLPVLAQYAQARACITEGTRANELWQVMFGNRQLLEALGQGWGQFDRKTYAREVLSHSEIIITNQLEGNPEEGLEYFQRIHYLDANNSPLQTLSALVALTQLQYLYLNDTGVIDAGLSALVALTQLQHLQLDNTGVTDAGLPELVALTQLQELSLSNTGVTDAGLPALAALTQLRTLYLDNTGVTDAGLPALVALTQLRTLYLGNTGVTDAGLSALKTLTQLQYLYLNNTGVADAGLSALKTLTQLQYLNLNNTGVTDAGLSALKTLTQLQYLFLNNPGVTDAGLPALVALTQLQYLFLSNTGVTDAGLTALVALTQLQYLDLNNTGVTDAGLSALVALTQLQHLQLYNTGVTHAGVAKLKQTLPNLRVSH